ncbi:hypothetical protein [Aquimarina sp. MMG016]|uniref:hypothetical protein n=1 Tax=Aquimarina sp. MMG016 TaxID=2822690 RepID=UPI001B3A641C|nr:hypothetical protein [Aquimarina sp. MMG016]MBQ4819522.1 hypothetical protein [Aquimarina sp. MMG016]
MTNLIAPPLVDGNCNEYIKLGANSISISEDVNLYIFQDDYYVWISYCYPEGSYGTVDLEIETNTISDPLNLHVSAQMGEWPLNNKDLKPKNPESDLWWKTNGWTANPVWINGMDKTADRLRYKFKNGEAREIQLSKNRFGKGEWKIRMNVRSILNKAGEFYDIEFPENDEAYLIEVD